MTTTSDADLGLLDRTFDAAAPRLEVAIAACAARGVTSVVAFVERKFDGEIVVGCGTKAAVPMRLDQLPSLDPSSRAAIVAFVRDSPPATLPVIVLAHCEGYVATGLRRVEQAPMNMRPS